MAGALTERDFVTKLERAGFTKIAILERSPLGVDDCALYPLFTTDVLDLMRTLIPPRRQQTIGTAVVVRARRAGTGRGRIEAACSRKTGATPSTSPPEEVD